MEEYSKGLEGVEKQNAVRDIENFFNDYVEKGFKDLEKFSSLLLQDLKDGNDVEITIKGYTSPLNTAEYNENLAKRRISSLINYIDEYNNGIFMPYIKGTAPNGGKLKIFQDPIGEAQASKLVSDNPQDIRNSVYSRSAALERRIQIILYVSDKGETSVNRPITNVFFKEYYHDLGTVSANDDVPYVFSFENIGENDLYISSIQVSCGCTSVKYPKNAIKPGEKSEINVVFNPHGKKGEQEESITINANIPNGYTVIGLSALISE